LDILKRIAELIPFLEPYPIWVKFFVGGWTLATAALLLALVFAPRKEQTVEPFHLVGRVLSTNADAVPTAIIELSVAEFREEATTDSEGYFGIDATRPKNTVNGRIRISATGYRTYDRVVQLRVDSTDLGIFTLQPDGARRENDDDPAAQLQRRQQALLEPPRDVLDKYTSQLDGTNAGAVKLLSEATATANSRFLQVRGEGRYFSFLRRTHENGQGSDIKFEDGKFSTGFAGLDYGYFLNVGDVPFQDLAAATSEPPSWLSPSKADAWRFMWSYVPPNVTVEVRRAQREARSRVVGRTVVAENAAAVPGSCFLLRSITFNDSDLLVAIRAERLTNDGSMVLVWRILKTFDTPVATGPEPEI
jgi:hypothetical protein